MGLQDSLFKGAIVGGIVGAICIGVTGNEKLGSHVSVAVAIPASVLIFFGEMGEKYEQLKADQNYRNSIGYEAQKLGLKPEEFLEIEAKKQGIKRFNGKKEWKKINRRANGDLSVKDIAGVVVTGTVGNAVGSAASGLVGDGSKMLLEKVSSDTVGKIFEEKDQKMEIESTYLNDLHSKII